MCDIIPEMKEKLFKWKMNSSFVLFSFEDVVGSGATHSVFFMN